MHPLERLSHGTQLKVTKFILQESGTYNTQSTLDLIRLEFHLMT